VTLRTFRRGGSIRSCEMRVNSEGDRFELVVTHNEAVRVESFASLEAMLTRERELLSGWRAHCWQEGS
jgi:hypothetical protein